MLKNRVALAHKRPRVHFLDTSEKHLGIPSSILVGSRGASRADNANPAQKSPQIKEVRYI